MKTKAFLIEIASAAIFAGLILFVLAAFFEVI